MGSIMSIIIINNYIEICWSRDTQISWTSKQCNSTILNTLALVSLLKNKDIDITENDLLKCSVHIKKNLPKLAGAFGITKEQLNEIQQNYEDPSSQAYQLLLKCMEARPSTTRQDLKEKFEILKFSKAAQQ